MRVLADEIGWTRVYIREIAAPSARNANFLAGGLGMIDNQCAGASMGGAHHASGPCANDQCVDIHKVDVPWNAVACKCSAYIRLLGCVIVGLSYLEVEKKP